VYSLAPERVDPVRPQYDEAIRYGGACFFNGTFVSREAYELVGNVDKKLILWGDEVNYFMRVNRAYGTVPVVMNSVHFHPPIKYGNSRVPLWKQYLVARNTTYNSFNFSRFGQVGVLFGLYNVAKKVMAGEIRFRVAVIGMKEGITSALPEVAMHDLIQRFSDEFGKDQLRID
jgi:GT2 family glycosyltransferase